jgi:hypothetical protein
MSRVVRAFTVWQKDRPDTSRELLALNAPQAAEQQAREDYQDPSWRAGTTYRVRDAATGVLCEASVFVKSEPSFVARLLRVIEIPSMTHVLWGARVLCEDLRLRGVPAEWPEAQRWMSLKDVADGVPAPSDRCEDCWSKALELIDESRHFGKEF